MGNLPFQLISRPFRDFLQLFSAIFHAQNHATTPQESLTAFPERRFCRIYDSVFCMKKSCFSCRKALPTLQRGRCHRATAAPLHCRKGSVGEPGGPYGRTIAARRNNGGNRDTCIYLRISVLQNKTIFGPQNSLIFNTRVLAEFEPAADFFQKVHILAGLKFRKRITNKRNRPTAEHRPGHCAADEKNARSGSAVQGVTRFPACSHGG